ncbi:flavoprotein-like protein [Baffinella frigidus]|nr:flavoprotein-like protein [Cryptophyta sp. CCMP2293]
MAAEGRNRRLLVLFGSQTGCAEEVAHRIGREAAKRFFRPVVPPGDAPDTMRAFWAFLLRKSLPPDSLDSVSFSVFGLGDSSYAKYNTAAKRLARRLEGLGASCMLDIGLGDDQDRAGYDQALDPWLASLWPALLAKHLT